MASPGATRHLDLTAAAAAAAAALIASLVPLVYPFKLITVGLETHSCDKVIRGQEVAVYMSDSR